MLAKGPNAKVRTGKTFRSGCFPDQCNTVINIKGDVIFNVTVNVDGPQLPNLLGQLIADPAGALFGGGGLGRIGAEPDPDKGDEGGEGEPASGGGMPG